MRSNNRDSEFTSFVAEHRASLVRMSRLLTAGNDAAAEDVVQTALTKLYIGWDRFRRADNQVGYARATLTHVFIDEARRGHRRREVAVQELPPRPDRQTDPTLRTVVLESLASLPARQRAVVVLRHWVDLSVSETADVLNCSEGTVKSQNAKALAHLRASLGPAFLTTTGDPRCTT